MSETPYSDELDEILMKLARNTTLADRAAGVASTASTLKDASKIFDWSISEAKAAIQSIIRTEKLKLLAEVRERVVGGRLDLRTFASDLEVKPDLETAVWVMGKDRHNELIDKQREALTELEAEL